VFWHVFERHSFLTRFLVILCFVNGVCNRGVSPGCITVIYCLLGFCLQMSLQVTSGCSSCRDYLRIVRHLADKLLGDTDCLGSGIFPSQLQRSTATLAAQSQNNAQRTSTQQIFVEQYPVPEGVTEQFNVPAEHFCVPEEHWDVPEESSGVPRTKTQLRNFLRRRQKYFQRLSTPIPRPLTHVVGDSPKLRREEASPSFGAAGAAFTTQLTTRLVAQSTTSTKFPPPISIQNTPAISTQLPPTISTQLTRTTNTQREEASLAEQTRALSLAPPNLELQRQLPAWKTRRLERLSAWEARRRDALRKEQAQFRQRLHHYRLQFLRTTKPARSHTTHARTEIQTPKRRWEVRPTPKSSPTLASLNQPAEVYVELTQKCSTVDTSVANNPAGPTMSIIDYGPASIEWELSPTYTSPGYTSESSPAGDPPAGLPVVSNISTAQQDPGGDSWDEATELAVGHYEALKPVEQASRRSRFLRSEEKPPPPSRRERRPARAQETEMAAILPSTTMALPSASTISTTELSTASTASATATEEKSQATEEFADRQATFSNNVQQQMVSSNSTSHATEEMFSSNVIAFSDSIVGAHHSQPATPPPAAVAATAATSYYSTLPPVTVASPTPTGGSCMEPAVSTETDHKRKRKKRTNRGAPPPACPTDAQLLEAFREWQAIYSGIAEILEEDYPPLVVQHYDYWAEQGLGYICASRVERDELVSMIRPRAT
jgi:hypothetical protein